MYLQSWDIFFNSQKSTMKEHFPVLSLSTNIEPGQHFRLCRGYALQMGRLKIQKQRCTELPLFLFSLCHMVELVHETALYGTPIFSLLFVSHGGISS